MLGTEQQQRRYWKVREGMHVEEEEEGDDVKS